MSRAAARRLKAGLRLGLAVCLIVALVVGEPIREEPAGPEVVWLESGAGEGGAGGAAGGDATGADAVQFDDGPGQDGAGGAAAGDNVRGPTASSLERRRGGGDAAGGETGAEAARLAELLGSLASGAGPALVVRSHTTAPSATELDLLAALAARVPLVTALPDRGPTLRVDAPDSPRVLRTTALPFTVYGEPGAEARVRLQDDAGELDSLVVRLDDEGSATGAFRLRPARAGWHEWHVAAETARQGAGAAETVGQGTGAAATVGQGTGVAETVGQGSNAAETAAHGPETPANAALEDGDDTPPPDPRAEVVGAWVQDAEPPQILVLAPSPTWESRFVVGALEEAGLRVDAVLPLAPDLFAGGRTSLPTDDHTLGAYDAVLLLPGARVGDAEREALERHVVERGGGLLLMADTAGWRRFGLGGHGPPREVVAAELHWSLPAELAPLPPTETRSNARPLRDLRPGTAAAAVAGEDVVLALRSFGYGRVAGWALDESWRWRMEDGRVAEHREFWRSIVDWLAAGRREAVRLRVDRTRPVVGTPVEIELRAPPGTRPPELWLERPDRNAQTPVTVVPDAGDPGVWYAAVLPQQAGLHTLVVGGSGEDAGPAAPGPAAAGFRALPTVAADSPRDAWAQLALLAHTSGGDALPSQALAGWVEQWRLRQPSTVTTSHGWLPWLLFGLALGFALVEWTVRRLAAPTEQG